MDIESQLKNRNCEKWEFQNGTVHSEIKNPLYGVKDCRWQKRVSLNFKTKQ